MGQSTPEEGSPDVGVPTPKNGRHPWYWEWAWLEVGCAPRSWELGSTPYSVGASSVCRCVSLYKNMQLENLMDMGIFSITERFTN